jgi:hypothetical protein
MLSKNAIKGALGEIPLTAEAYWILRRGGSPVDPHFSLDRLEARLPGWQAQARAAAQEAPPGKRIMVFATLRYWIEHATLLGLTLAGVGHDVTLAFLPYGSWKEPANRFDLRRQNAYAKQVLRLAEPAVRVASLLDSRGKSLELPTRLQSEIEDLAKRDTQYTLQVEEIDPAGGLYHLRLERDRQAALAALSWISASEPEVVVIPNGSILEFGAVYAAARRLGLKVVTYEFGEQDQRIWISQDGPVMFQETGALWQARKDVPLTPAQQDRIEQLFESRQGARRWENFARRWQGAPSEGAAQARKSLGLDTRPLVLMATNVIGDSLTLGRQAFSETMTEWIQRTGEYFARRNDCQFVVRIHPGEALMKGPSVLEVLDRSLAGMPENFRLVPAAAPVNTYDLIANADLGLVYTTTAGLEMVMSGVPVIVSGRTHYRSKGFTYDPSSWEEYFNMLDSALGNSAMARPSQAQVELAWRYAYSFFFEYPRPFPWHLLHYWDKLDEWPLERVLSPEGRAAFGDTFRHLSGEPLVWEEMIDFGT